MKLSIAEIYRFTVSTLSYRNFIEGERVFHAGQVIFCSMEAGDETCKESSLNLLGRNSFF